VLQGIVSQRLIARADGKGRVLASEVLCASHAMRTCIRERKMEQIVGLMEIGYRDGNRTIDQSIVDLFKSGLITRDEAFYHCRDRKVIELAFATPPPVPNQA
jgi:twitching motility protein PilT